MAKNIFDIESEDRIESPEAMNKYIRLASPGLVILLSAMLLMLVCFVIWGFAGRIPETFDCKGVVDPTLDYDLTLVVPAGEHTGPALVDKEARYTLSDGKKGMGTIVYALQYPQSREEIREILENDYFYESMVTSDYSYLLQLAVEDDLKEYELEIAEVTIITNEVPPIHFMLK